ncbi:MAG: glycine cleavage system regulatory protein [Myxococcota bacterium]|jgi:glycine cleavage system regulatory protein
MTSLVLTILGPDRVGLVEALSDTVTRHEANWLESRMSQLAGQFAGLLRVSVPPNKTEGLIEALRSLEAVQVHVLRSDRVTEPATQLVHLRLVGHDRPGIVADITHALAADGVNVEDLETHCEAAAMSGDPLFHARAVLRVPADLDMDDVAHGLEKIANDLMVEIDLEEA